MISGPVGLAMIAVGALLSAIYVTSPLSETVFRPKRGRKLSAIPRDDQGFLRKLDEQSIRRNHQPLT